MKKTLMALIAVLCLAVAAYAAETMHEGMHGGAMAKGERCPVCGMVPAMYPDWNTEIEFSDGSHAAFEGPKDMFKYYLDIPRYNPSKSQGNISKIEVRDYNSKARIDARKAFFVIWADVLGPMGHEPVAFEKEQDAQEFMKAHKGKGILRFEGITKDVLHSLDNP